MVEVIVLALLICLLIYFLNTKLGKRLKLRASGTAEEVINQDAKTPEGAKAYYNAAISKKEEELQKANKIYSQMIGKISSFEKTLRELQKSNMKLSIDITTCVDSGEDEIAKSYLKQQQENEEKIEILKSSLSEVKENSVLQKEMVDSLTDELNDLKSEKEKEIFTLETVQVTKSLKATSYVGSDEEEKMLQKVRDGIQKAKEEAEGNRFLYENSEDVKEKRNRNKLAEKDIEKKLNELKAKKGKN